MRVYLFQILTAFSIVIRMIIILAIGGPSQLGVFTMMMSTTMITTVLIQIYNNQAIQIKLMDMDEEGKQQTLNSILVIGWICSLLVLLCIMLFGKYFDLLNNISTLKMWGTALFASTLISYTCSVYDLKSLVEGRLKLYYLSLAIGAVLSAISCFLILHFSFTSYIVFIPAFSSISIWLFYIYTYNIKFSLKIFRYRSGFNFKNFWLLIRETWQINLIPLTTVSLDFVVRSVFLSTVGLVSLGYYQTIVSIEAMTGNIFQGPFFKKIVLSYKIDDGKNQYSIKKNIFGTIIISILPIFGLIGMMAINNYYNLSDKFKVIFLPIILILSMRVVWGIWGGLGQVLLVKKHFLFVSIVEVFNKVLIAICLIIFLCFFDFGLWSYFYSILIVGAVLILLIIALIRNKIKNINLY